jgi:hypothetical protein
MSSADLISVTSAKTSLRVPRKELLTALRAAGHPDTRLEELEISSISKPIASATAGLWRLRTNDASVILKVLRHSADGQRRWRSGESPDHPYYWRREACAYESELLDGLRDDLRAPRCLGVFDRPDGGVDLWL